ncbi:MAG: TrmH family RNA methyltransferase [Phycisphaerales bacterium]
MPNFVEISSPDGPELRHYRGLVEPGLQSLGRAGSLPYFIAEGQLVVEKLVASSFELHSLLMTPERAALMAGCLDGVTVPVFLAPAALIHQIAGFEFNRGVLASGVRPSMGDALGLVRSARVIVALEHVSNPDNIGGIFRTVAAIAGRAGAVLLGPGCADPLYRKSVRVSMGHVFSVPWAVTPDLEGEVRHLVGAGATALATTPAAGAQDVRAGLGGLHLPVVVLAGPEGEGLSPNMLRTATRLVRIPMAEGVDSLNVGVATAIVLDRVIERIGTEPGGVSCV